jgi:hypothetical protein
LANPKVGRFADFACGSGTLLVATYSATNTKYRYSLLKKGIDKNPADIERKFHNRFMGWRIVNINWDFKLFFQKNYHSEDNQQSKKN